MVAYKIKDESTGAVEYVRENSAEIREGEKSAEALPVMPELTEGQGARLREVDGALAWEVYDLPIEPIPDPEPAPAPREFSKLKLVGALMQLGVWEQVKAWIESTGLYDLYLAAVLVDEDNPYFVQGRTALQAQLGMTDEQVETILAQCVSELR